MFTAGAGGTTPGCGRVCADLEWLGITVDPQANSAAAGLARISSADSRTAVLVVPTDEELEIAQQTLGLLAG